MQVLLSASGIFKNFGRVEVLRGLQIEVKRGETIGLMGPNGAGKTTLFNVISGFILPDRGKVHFLGRDITSDPPYKRARSGIYRTFQRVRIAEQMTIMDNLLLAFQDRAYERPMSALCRIRDWLALEHTWRRRAFELLKEMNLESEKGRLARDLSYGQQKLLSLALGIASDAKLMLLDEPLAGLSSSMVDRAINLIKIMVRKRSSIIIIEHNTSFLEQMCDYVLFMAQGQILYQGNLQELREHPGVLRSYLGGQMELA